MRFRLVRRTGITILLAFLVSLSFGDGQVTRQLGSALVCQAASLLVRDLPRDPLYVQSSGQCVQTDSLGGVRFLDASCESSVDTGTLSFEAFCDSVTVAGQLGNGEGLPPAVEQWLSTPGTRVPVTLPGLTERSEPYLGRLKYREVAHPDGGVCALEMRVYTAHPAARHQPAVLALHGGGWARRKDGFPGLESLVSHFTDRGMVVFAPFYRLVGKRDGPEACRGWSAEDVVADAEAALDWVLANGSQHGAAAVPPVVFGQSAGAFLGSWLSVERREDVSAALLMYPPTDFGDFAEQVVAGHYTDRRGIKVFERFFGESPDLWQQDAARLEKFSLAKRVAMGAAVAPLRIVHGLDDALVSVRQSELLCAASRSRQDWLAVRSRVYPSADAQQSRSMSCASGGQLDLLAGADHALEVCVGGIACQAGNLRQSIAASAVLRNSYDWLRDRARSAHRTARQSPSVRVPVSRSD